MTESTATNASTQRAAGGTGLTAGLQRLAGSMVEAAHDLDRSYELILEVKTLLGTNPSQTREHLDAFLSAVADPAITTGLLEWIRACAHHHLGEERIAVESLQNSVELCADPGPWLVRLHDLLVERTDFIPAFVVLANALADLGDLEKAVAVAELALQSDTQNRYEMFTHAVLNKARRGAKEPNHQRHLKTVSVPAVAN